MKGPKIGRIDLRRRPFEERPRSSGLGERDDVAQRGCTREQHYDAVEAEREPAMRWRPGGKTIEQEAEAATNVCLGDAKQ